MVLKKNLLFLLLFFITSCSIISNDEKINKINTEEKYIKLENKKILIGNIIEKKDKNLIIPSKKIDKKETIDMLKYQLSLEDDFLKNKNYLEIPKLTIKKIKLDLLTDRLNSLPIKLDNNKIENQQKSKNLKLQVKKEKLINRLIFLDYFIDDSITKYTDDKIHYNNLWYVPENLINLKWKYIIDTKKNSKVRKITLKKLKLLSEKYYIKFWVKLRIISAYRSYKYQKGIKDRGCPDLFCAKAWYSEHQSWLAIDFWEATDEKKYINNKKLKKYFDWMKINWPKYGFTNTYQKWKKTDWYAVEPWHWRYVWKDLSIYMYKNNLTFAEFFYSEIKK